MFAFRLQRCTNPNYTSSSLLWRWIIGVIGVAVLVLRFENVNKGCTLPWGKSQVLFASSTTSHRDPVSWSPCSNLQSSVGVPASVRSSNTVPASRRWTTDIRCRCLNTHFRKVSPNSVFVFQFQILWRLAEELIEMKITTSSSSSSSSSSDEPVVNDELPPLDSSPTISELPSVIPWTSLSPEDRKSWHVKLHAQLRAIVNTLCLPSPERISTKDENYRNLFVTYVTPNFISIFISIYLVCQIRKVLLFIHRNCGINLWLFWCGITP